MSQVMTHPGRGTHRFGAVAAASMSLPGKSAGRDDGRAVARGWRERTRRGERKRQPGHRTVRSRPHAEPKRTPGGPGAGMELGPLQGRTEEPTRGLEPRTPSLRGRIRAPHGPLVTGPDRQVPAQPKALRTRHDASVPGQIRRTRPDANPNAKCF